MQDNGPGIDEGTLAISARFVERLAALTASRESAERFFTSPTREELEEELFLNDDDDDLDDSEMDWTTDELGLDPFEDEEI